MNFILRSGKPEDGPACGKICFDAFTAISNRHNFPPDIPSAEIATGFLTMLLSRPDIYSIVAEAGGKIIGSNFLWEGDTIAGIGPITIDPKNQDGGVGRRMMEDVMARVAQKNFAGARLVQAAFHSRSLSLYTKLGFDVREPLACIQGTPLKKSLPGFVVREAAPADLQACNELCRKVHGHDRKNELSGAVQQKTATVAARDGKIAGYTTGIGFFTHAVAENNDALKALIAAAPEFAGPGFLLPSRNGEVFRWCLNEGLRVTQPMTLMSIGLYNEPRGAFLPSILY
ncbi:MAG TPA: GNAT family N-acetyltransferase [Verrucomicrobiae bacterium]|nr:GNAT family N-acetyltransferase [Verrucomicrobiae bacterium]